MLPRGELERLLDLARRIEHIELDLREEELDTRALMRLADNGKAFDFWKDAGEDIYTDQDGEVLR
jgi:hypothetical protein